MGFADKSNEKIGAVNRGTPCESGLCSFCRVDCQGKCETWLSSLLGRRTLIPQNYGNASLGSDNTAPQGVSYNALRIRGRVFGAEGLDAEQAASGDVTYTDAVIATHLGSHAAWPCRFPFVLGALSRNPVVDKYWDSFAVGAALCGIPLVIGENVGGGDTRTVFNKDGSIKALPDLDRRIASYLRYHDGNGVLFVQLNPNDAHNGVGDYVARVYGDKVCIEFKWGQGAKPLNGEGRITSLDFARFMKSRSYCLRPDPEDPEVARAFQEGRLPHFTRYTSMAYTGFSEPDAVQEEMARQRDGLKELGATRFALKTGAFGAPEVALGIRIASELGFELFTIDGSGGGTGMSPVDVMDQWGVPSV
ncbi:FMN-binding glutamate synthase family protein, partial [uncultured Desulfovibrio sp.]